MVSVREVVICSIGKLGFLTGDTKAPNKNDPTYSTWVAENSIVMAWLINSMEPKIGKIFMFLQTAKASWDSAKKKYSNIDNAAQIFDLKTRMKEIKQGNMSMNQYHTKLEYIWQELDLFSEFDLGCEECYLKQKKMIERERVFEF